MAAQAGEQGMARVRGVWRRRRPWIVLTATVILAGAAVAIGRTPSVYRAQVVLRALESQPAREYVPPTSMEQVGERLRTLRIALMARPLLEQAVADLDLATTLRVSPAEAVEALRTRIEVKLEGDDTYLMTVEDANPALAARIAERVATLFVERQVHRREQVARATEEALSAEVGRLRPEVDRLDARVREFKQGHEGRLPEQQEHNLRELDQTTMEYNILSTTVDAGEEHRRQMLAGVLSTLRHPEGQLEAQLHEALTKYTPLHPEVLRLRAELDKVRHQRERDEVQMREHAEANPELASLGVSIRRGRAQMEALRKRQEAARTRLSETAVNGQVLAEMSTQLDAVRQKYQVALSRLFDAQLAAVVERNLRDQRFETVEAAAQPLHPVRPDRVLLSLAALLAAMVAGLGVGFARDFLDPTVHGPEGLRWLDAERPLDVLGCIPEDGA